MQIRTIREIRMPQSYMLMIFPLILILSFVSSVRGQEFQRLISEVPVEQNGQQLQYSMLGGLDRFIPQLVDIDADGDLDLFILEPGFSKILQPESRLMFLRNDGSPALHEFALVSDSYGGFNCYNWFFFVDADHDSDYDLYLDNGDFGLAFHRNTGSAQNAVFVLESEEVLDTGGAPVFSEPTSVPVFADIDSDGDSDFFSGITTGTIALYRNVGNAAEPLFEFETDTWEDLVIISFGKALSSPDSQHGASAIDFADLDGDGDLEFFYGDFFHKGVYHFANLGSPADPNIVLADSLFPEPQSLSNLGHNVPRFADFDADGDPDFFAASQRQNRDNFYFYRNVGDATTPQLKIASNNFLPALDVGSNSAPALVDLDADGDLDLLIGNLDGQLAHYENLGTATNPAFRWVTDSFQNIRVTSYVATPAFADIDADGDPDLFIGSYAGNVAFYENRGTPQSASFVLVTSDFGNIEVGLGSAPAFSDVDRDGDLDMFVGEVNQATVGLYENIGTAQQAQFQLRREITSGNLVDSSAPFPAHLNGDTYVDLLVGSRNGRLRYYEGTASPDSFILVDEEFRGMNVGTYSAPVLADLNADGRLDILCGEGAGGLNYYQNSTTSSVGSHTPPMTFEMRAYPNPFEERLNIIAQSRNARVDAGPFVLVFDIQGRIISRMAMEGLHDGIWRTQWMPERRGIAAGIYFIQVRWGEVRTTKKVLFVNR